MWLINVHTLFLYKNTRLDPYQTPFENTCCVRSYIWRGLFSGDLIFKGSDLQSGLFWEGVMFRRVYFRGLIFRGIYIREFLDGVYFWEFLYSEVLIFRRGDMERFIFEGFASDGAYFTVSYI